MQTQNGCSDPWIKGKCRCGCQGREYGNRNVPALGGYGWESPEKPEESYTSFPSKPEESYPSFPPKQEPHYPVFPPRPEQHYPPYPPRHFPYFPFSPEFGFPCGDFQEPPVCEYYFFPYEWDCKKGYFCAKCNRFQPR